MTKTQIATEIIDEMLELDLINTVDYTLESAKADLIEILMRKFKDLLIVQGNVMEE